MAIIGVDTGGTFTDFVYQDGDHWGVYKVLSTPADPAAAVLGGLQRAAGGQPAEIVHGSTVATNTLLERTGARTAFITNRGFEDLLEIGRQHRSRLYDLNYRKDPHLVPPELRFGVGGRIGHTAEELEPFSEADAREVLARLAELKVEAVAVGFLFSFLNPSHERLMEAMLAEFGGCVSLSHEIVAEFREFERFSTTVVNAFVRPRMEGYLGRLSTSLDPGSRLRIMQSNGGSIAAKTAMKESVRTILSGPAGGVVGAFEIGRAAGFTRLITFDMGGTSTDVSLVDGAPTFTMEASVSGYPLKAPTIDIHTVGAGGGSIAALDAGGSLTVGPRSAGADPGPVCYGAGSEITVTDANLYLGRLVADTFLGGAMTLDSARTEDFLARAAAAASLSPRELAEGIITVVNTTMEKAIRVISVERGYDPREFTLVSFGGAGGLHAPFLARLLEIPRVLVPRDPGVLSALGMVLADVVRDYSLTVMRMAGEDTSRELAPLFRELEGRGRAELAAEGIGASRITLELYLDMRYQGQSYEIIVPFGSDPVDRFHRLHEKTYGHHNRERPVEVVNVRLRARGAAEKPPLEPVAPGTPEPPEVALVAVRPVVFDGEQVETPVYDRGLVPAGSRLQGPALLVEYSATTVIPPSASAIVDPYGNLIVELGG